MHQLGTSHREIQLESSKYQTILQQPSSSVRPKSEEHQSASPRQQSSKYNYDPKILQPNNFLTNTQQERIIETIKDTLDVDSRQQIKKVSSSPKFGEIGLRGSSGRISLENKNLQV